jgi:CspA family cold shock protein
MVGRALSFSVTDLRRPSAAWPLPKIELAWACVGSLLSASFTQSGKGFPMRVNGTVKFFNTAKGFGFITPDEGGKDVFVHATAVERAGMRALNEGDRVSFELEDDRRGRGKQAAQLKPA